MAYLEDLVCRLPDQLDAEVQEGGITFSTGQRQLLAIARAMAHEPAVVMADEPTASLDPINAEKIMRLFSSLAEEHQVTLIVATHEWDRVRELGFRTIRFDLKDQKRGVSVQSRVIG